MLFNEQFLLNESKWEHEKLIEKFLNVKNHLKGFRSELNLRTLLTNELKIKRVIARESRFFAILTLWENVWVSWRNFCGSLLALIYF